MNLIIFDFYGVIGGELAPKWFNNHFNNEEAKQLKNKYFVPGDEGKYTIQEIFEMMAKDLGFTYDEILNEFKSNVYLNTELIDYIKELRKTNKVALLSNACEGIYELFFPNLKLDEMFDKVFLSFKHKLIKPNLEFYKLCVNSFNEKFDKIYMIDDNISNIIHLDQIGITGIHYKNNEDLFEKLK